MQVNLIHDATFTKYLKLLLIAFRDSMATCTVVDKMEEIVLPGHVQSLLTQ